MLFSKGIRTAANIAIKKCNLNKTALLQALNSLEFSKIIQGGSLQLQRETGSAIILSIKILEPERLILVNNFDY